jgi:hypothetical protein
MSLPGGHVYVYLCKSVRLQQSCPLKLSFQFAALNPAKYWREPDNSVTGHIISILVRKICSPATRFTEACHQTQHYRGLSSHTALQRPVIRHSTAEACHHTQHYRGKSSHSTTEACHQTQHYRGLSCHQTQHYRGLSCHHTQHYRGPSSHTALQKTVITHSTTEACHHTQHYVIRHSTSCQLLLKLY